MLRVLDAPENRRRKGMNKSPFRYDPHKAVHVVAYLAGKDLPDMSAFKIAKLLFWADKIHLQRYGRPVTASTWERTNHGPIPSEILNVLNVLSGTDTKDIAKRDFDAVADEARRLLRVVLADHPKFVATAPADLDYFSDSDLEVLDRVVADYGRLCISAIWDKVHAEPAVRKADEGRVPGKSASMDYALFTVDMPEQEQRQLVEALAEQRQNRAFTQAFSR